MLVERMRNGRVLIKCLEVLGETGSRGWSTGFVDGVGVLFGIRSFLKRCLCYC